MKAAAAVLVAVLAVVSVACAGDDGAEPVTSRQCAPLLYEGEGEPDVIIVSDLPRRGIGAKTSELMIGAIEFVLRERDFRARDRRVGYQACNDTIGEEPFDPSLCRRNARAYVETDAVLGVIGPWNSGCAFEQIPIISQRNAGPLAMVSPSATNPELTLTEPGPESARSYARVVAHDFVQGAAGAYLADGLGAQRAVILHGDLRDDYVRSLAEPFEDAAQALGIETVRFPWPLQKSYSALAESVAAARPDVVYLAGLTQDNGKVLVEDLRAVLPRSVRLIAPDGFAHREVARELGAAGEGMLVTSYTSFPPELLPPAGKRFVREFGHSVEEPGFLGAPEAAQATEVLLDAIARSDGTRASVVDQVFATKVEGGILGSFSFDRYGDIVPRPVPVYRFEKGTIVAHDIVRTPTRGE